jgi:DNA-binding CsgD family transcriptional regulator/tetratricopeptide (TPR) repeat protein
VNVAWPLVGRRAELQALKRDLLDSTDGGVVLAGMAGVGKTRLAREALAQARRAGRETVWVGATRSAASIPFGAVSHLLPAGEHLDEERWEALRWATDELARRAGPNRLVLGVDDAHLLDDASAALVHLLVTRSLAVVVATVRSGERAPDSIVALWKDGLARRMTVPTLTGAAMEQLLGHALDGQIDAVTRHRLIRVAEGNPLYLRELIIGGLETGTLYRRGEVWRWTGSLRGAARLAELVGARLDGLGPAERATIELAACGEPLPLAVLERLADRATVEAAERVGLLAVERSGRRTWVRLAHPLYGEVLRATLPVARARFLWGALAEAYGGEHLRRRDDQLLVGTWQLEAGSASRPGVFLPAARQAVGRFDLELGERLARAACDAGGGQPASQFLAETLGTQGRHTEAVRVLAGAPPTHGDRQYARWAVTRAANLYWGLARTTEAQKVLDEAAAAVSNEADRDDVAAMQAMILLFDGRCREALAVASPVVDRPDAVPVAVVGAAAVAVVAGGLLGTFQQALATAERALAVWRHDRDDAPWGEAMLGWARCRVLAAAGELREARAQADRGYHAAVAERSPWLAGAWAGFRGMVARMQGQVVTARASLTEAVALLGEHDPYRFVRLWQGELACSAALTGDHAGAARWLAEMDRRTDEANKLFEPRLELDRAWVAAGAGELTRAVALAARAAELARAAEHHTVEVTALHDIARLGRAELVADRLGALAASIEGRFASAAAASAAALAASDGGALDEVAATFEELGASLLAAEAAVAAARSHQASGRQASAKGSLVRAATLAAACEGARTPALQAGELRSLLTAREQEVAALAGAGVPSRQIAERLGLSVRTVDNYLGRAYAKLGISGRSELGELLDRAGRGAGRSRGPAQSQ